MFKEPREALGFSWDQLGDIAIGRPHLGDATSATIYRLMQYTLRDVLIRRLGPKAAGDIFYEAGKRAGEEFCKHLLDPKLEFNAFIAQLQERLKENGVGIFRVEEASLEDLTLQITVAEDLDCSGLPVSDEMVCDYDEGFIAGILETYTGEPIRAKEIDCWASGARICRFRAVRDEKKD